MIHQLLVSTALVMVTVIFHGLGLALLGRVLRDEAKEEIERHVPGLSARAMLFTLYLVFALFALHGTEIWLYAAFFELVSAVPDLETAVYFSTISYAGIGFDDSYIVKTWRLVAAIEGINGLLLLGWSTAFYVTMVARLNRR